jgi:sec-independent protein translocase protein TatA
MFRSIGAPEIILIFLVVILIFGATRIPQLGSAIGKGIREFRSAVKGGHDEAQSPPAKVDDHKTNKI